MAHLLEMTPRRLMLGLVIVTALLAAQAQSTSAHPGPCSAALTQFRHQRARAEAQGPIGKQALGAQLHHQPTPNDVERGERLARERFRAALNRARAANAAGRASACRQALRKAKDLYGKL